MRPSATWLRFRCRHWQSLARCPASPRQCVLSILSGRSRVSVRVCRNRLHAATHQEITLGVGAAFPHKEGAGFSIEISAIPLDGRLVVLPPDGNEDPMKESGKRHGEL